MMFRKIRIAILLLILLFVGLNALTESSYPKEWRSSIQVALYPVNADGSDAAAGYINTLQAADFATIETFFDQQAHDYDLKLDHPFRFTLAPPLQHVPPLINTHPSRLDIMWWSLRLRWFAWRAPTPPGPMVRIRMFLLYHDPARATSLPDSIGLQKGMLGIAHLFAADNQRGANQVVIAHELLHTLGATDKYDLSNNQPIYPDGFGDPDQEPHYPQQQAELMAGRIAISPLKAIQPDSLRQVVIGPLTAREINWIKQ
ncbi:MAG TPA: hypothetical protein VG962_13330 [Steroidobacteraceae bacterium]|nr:hypothetical protein [Steroidobacteraceae bacterium]